MPLPEIPARPPSSDATVTRNHDVLPAGRVAVTGPSSPRATRTVPASVETSTAVILPSYTLRRGVGVTATVVSAAAGRSTWSHSPTTDGRAAGNQDVPTSPSNALIGPASGRRDVPVAYEDARTPSTPSVMATVWWATPGTGSRSRGCPPPGASSS